MKKISAILKLITDPLLLCGIIGFAIITLISFVGGLYLWSDYVDTNPPNITLSENLELIKNKLTFLFSLLTASGLLATILYNIRQFNYIQKQNAVQEFEKKFYNRIDYLDTVVLSEMKYRHPILRREFFDNTDPNNMASFRTEQTEAQKRESFLYFNEIFLRIIESDKYWDRKFFRSKTDMSQTEMLRAYKYISDRYNIFIYHGDEFEFKKYFHFYLQTFTTIAQLIDEQEELTHLQKEKYLEILFTQLNQSQRFMIGMILWGGIHYKELKAVTTKYPEIERKYVKCGYDIKQNNDITVFVYELTIRGQIEPYHYEEEMTLPEL